MIHGLCFLRWTSSPFRNHVPSLLNVLCFLCILCAFLEMPELPVLFVFYSTPSPLEWIFFYEKSTIIYQNISSIIPGIHRQLVCSVKPCPILRNTMDCSMPGFPVLDYLPENSCPLNLWCHPTISSSDISFSSCLQSFPASGPFPMSQFLASGSRSIGASVSASVLWMNIQD